MAELAKGYVQIVPTMKGFKGALAKEMGQAASSEPVRKPFGKLGTTLSKVTSKTMKVGLASAGVAVGGTFSGAIAKGFGRLQAIEQARVGLEGMKLSGAQVAQVMENAKAAVKGTAYGFGDAATAAKGLVTAGVKPGQDLQRVLGLIADSAAQSGSSLGEMGYIFNQVASKGKLQAEEANMLLERGIPIWAAIGDQMGLTSAQVQDLASKGKISFEDMANAIEVNFGGSALKAGDTVKGSFDNMGAALSRFGEALLKDVYPKIPPLFNAISANIDQVTEKVAPVATRIVKAFSGALSVVRGLDFSGALAEALGEGNAATLTKPLIRIREEIGKTKSQLAGIGSAWAKTFSGLKVDHVAVGLSSLTSAAAGVRDVFTVVAAKAAPYVAQALAGVAGVAKNVLDAVSVLAPPFSRLASAVMEAAAPLQGAFVSATVSASKALVPIAQVVGKVADAVAKLPAPVLAAGAAMVSFRREIGTIQGVVNTSVGSFLSWRKSMSEMPDTFTRVSSSLSGLEKAGLLTSKNVEVLANRMNMIGTFGGTRIDKLKVGFTGLGMAIKNVGLSLKAAFMSNAVTLAIMGITTAISYFAQKNAEAEAKTQELAATLDQVTGAATEATRATVAHTLQTEGLAEQYKAAGGNMRDLVDAALGSEEAMARVKDVYKDANTELRDGAGHLIGYKEASDGVIPAVQDLAENIDKEGQNIREAAEASQTAASATRDLQKAQDEAAKAERERSNKILARNKAEREYAKQVQESAKNVEAVNRGEKDRTEVLDNLAVSVLDMVEANKNVGKGHEFLQQKMSEGRAQFIKTAEAMGYTTSEAERYADQLGLLPDSVTTKANLDTDQVLADIDGLKIAINKVDGTISINGETTPLTTTLGQIPGLLDKAGGSIQIDGDTFGAETSLQELMDAVLASKAPIQIGGETFAGEQKLGLLLSAVANSEGFIKINGKDFLARNVLNQLRSDAESKPIMITVDGNTGPLRGRIREAGNITLNVGVRGKYLDVDRMADGGLIKHFAGGSERHVAQIARPGAWRVWAEPETGGEAYIPLAKAKRQRSLEILTKVANHFGQDLHPKGQHFATGALISTPAPTYPQASGVTVNVTVSPRDLAGIRDVQEFVEKARMWQKGA